MKKLFKQLKSYKYYKQGMLIFAAIIIMSFFVGISMIMIKVTSSIKKSSADSAQQGTQYNTAANIVFLVRDQLQLIATDSYTKVLGFNWVNNTDLTKIVGKSTDIVQTIKILPKLGMETEYEDQFKPNSKNHKNIRKAATTNRGQTMMKKNSKAKTTGSEPTEATTYSVDAVINSPGSLTKFVNRANTIGGYWVETKDVRIDPTDNTQAEYIFQIYSYICDKPLEAGSMVCQDNGNIATYDQEVRIKRRCPYIVDNQLVVANDPGTDFYHLNCTCPCSTNCPDNSSDTGSGQATNVSGCNCLDTTYYWDATGGSCLPCPVGTTTDGQYDASNITSCMCNDINKPYWNYGNKLCEICPVNSNIDNTSGAKLYTIVEVLLSQSAPGSMYNSSTSSQTYYYSKCACPANYFLESVYVGPASNCLACPANCTTCTSATQCTGCASGYILSNDQCVLPSCPTGASNTGTGPATNIADCKCIDSSYSWDSATNSCIAIPQCPSGSSATGNGQPASSWVCKCRCTNLNPGTACPALDTYEAEANPTTTDTSECPNKCGPYGQRISQFPYLKSGKENCYCDNSGTWDGSTCTTTTTPSCPGNSSTTGTGELIQSTTTWYCKCIPGNTTPTASTINSAPEITVNNNTISCNTACSNYNSSYIALSGPTPYSKTVSQSQCKCPDPSYIWDNSINSCKQYNCPANSSLTGSGDATNTAGCKCNANFYWNDTNSACQPIHGCPVIPGYTSPVYVGTCSYNANTSTNGGNVYLCNETPNRICMTIDNTKLTTKGTTQCCACPGAHPQWGAHVLTNGTMPPAHCGNLTGTVKKTFVNSPE